MIPYIGITDFLDSSQVQRMLNVFNTNLEAGQKRRLHVGVMMSYKTLNNLGTCFAKAFPPKEKIASIFSSDGVMNCLHYADYEGILVYENLIRAIGFGGIGMNALQLDMVWPDPTVVEEAVRISQKRLEVILQIGLNSIVKAGNSIEGIVKYLEEYEGIIQHVLLDKSMGQGLVMDSVGFIPFIEAIKESFPNLGIAVAGGLGPDTIELLKPLVRRFPDISIDAQGRLRSSGNILDPVEWDRAELYLVKALNLLK